MTIPNEQVRAWLIGAYSSKEGSNYFVVVYNNEDDANPVGAEYFLTLGEALAAAETFKDKLIFVAKIN
jgi:hypothetical protein